MNNHCSNPCLAEPAEPHPSPPSTEHVPASSYTCTLEGRLLPFDEAVPLIGPVRYDAFGNCLDGCALQPCEADEENLPHTSTRAYNPTPGRWLLEDAVRFVAGDATLHRYVRCNASAEADGSSV